jgi:hypothetical protein
MDNSTIKLWNEIQDEFFSVMNTLTENFADEIKCSVTRHKYLTVTPSMKDDHYFLFELSLINNRSLKIVYCDVYFGYMADGRLHLSPNISIKIKSSAAAPINIRRYTQFRKIDNPLPYTLEFKQEGFHKHELVIFFQYWLKIISTDEIKSILYSDAWLDIPIDMSEYK